MPRRRLDGQRGIAVFLLGCVLFNFPVVAIFDQLGLLGGWSVLFVWLMSSWLAVIALVAWVARSDPGKGGSDPA